MENKEQTSENSLIKDNEKIDIVTEKFEKDKSFKKKIIIFLGTLLFLFAIICIIYYFFFYKLDLQQNISTDKQLEFIMINNKKEQITTQKYISDLNYTMRYDTTNFVVFKYKTQDVYRGLINEDVVIAVEKSNVPNSCIQNSTTNTFTSYNNCEILINSNTEQFYIYNKKEAYKITVNIPNSGLFDNNYQERVKIMINTFKIGNE